MNYKHWEKILIKEIEQAWAKSEKFLPCHGTDHHLRVWKNAEPFGLKKKADMEVLLASCLLHDISAFNPSPSRDHDKRSVKIANIILTKIKFPKEKINIVEKNIKQHRSSPQVPHSLEGAIMKSFDKIDAFGPIGVYRIITPMSIRGWSVEEIIKAFLYKGKLKKKWDSIAFWELKKKYKKDYEYTVTYFKQLAKL